MASIRSCARFLIVASSLGTLPIRAQSSDEWYPRPLHEPGCSAGDVAVADFDGDGRDDAATVGWSKSGYVVTVLLGRADGSFGAPASYPVEDNSYDVETGDLNHDGAIDLLASSAGHYNTPGYVSVLLARGSGQFAAAVAFPLDVHPTYLVLGDVDEDGELDVIALELGSTSGQARLLLGRGDGTFEPAIALPVSAPLYTPALVDLDGDGHLDLAGLEHAAARSFVRTYRGHGDGTFTANASTTLPWLSRALAFHDFDGDGLPEALVSGMSSNGPTATAFLELHPGTSTGFGRALNLWSLPSSTLTTTPRVADLDHDGLADVAVGHAAGTSAGAGIAFVRGLGGLAFGAPVEIRNGPQPLTLAIGDIEGDGDLDLLTLSDATDPLGVIHALVPGVFEPSAELLELADRPSDVALGDFDGDGNLDLAATGATTGQVFLWKGRGTGNFVPAAPLAAPTGLERVLLEDFTGDGRADVVAVGPYGQPGELRVWRATPQGFAAPDVYDAGAGPHALASGDFDGDGRRDIALAAGPSVRILHARADGTFELVDSVVMEPYGGTQGELLAADFDGDGHLDVAQIPHESCIQVAYGDGTGHLAQPICTSSYQHIGLLAAGDLDLDGKADIVFEEFDEHPGNLYALYGRADRTFDLEQFASLYEVAGAVIADFNGNGRPDVGANDYGALAVITGDGQRGFDPPRSFGLADTALTPVVADLDGDGELDVVAPLYYEQRIAVMLHR